MEGNRGEAPFLIGKILARPPSPICTGYWDRTPGQIIEDKEGGNTETSQQNINSRGDYRVGTKLGETDELQVQLL